MGKYQLTLRTLANVKGVLEVEASSPEQVERDCRANSPAWVYQ